jgi:hypothetical protein
MRLTRGGTLLMAGIAAISSLSACAAMSGSQRASLSAASSAHAPATGTAGAGAGASRGGAPVAGLVSTAHPDHVVGHGTAASCTSSAVVRAVREGGVITFSCGSSPVTIVMTATAKVRNTSRRVVLDGAGKVTLSGGGARRILYMDTCDKRQVWTTSHCDDQARPRIVVQNMTFAHGNSAGQVFDGGGGGAIFARGGRLRVINSRFFGNRCDSTGPDLGGAAIRALNEYHGRPVYIIHDTFRRGVCSNGAALSSIGVSWDVRDSLFAHNRAIGFGANPAQHGSPGGGSGGAIYTDGDRYTVRISGSIIRNNHAKEGGGAIFFVSNDRTGTLRIAHSTLHHNPSAGFHTAGYPGIFFLGAGHPVIIGSKLS